jgi:hypothetical protein
MPVVLLYQKVHAIDTDGGISIYPRTLTIEQAKAKERKKKKTPKIPDPKILFASVYYFTRIAIATSCHTSASARRHADTV